MLLAGFAAYSNSFVGAFVADDISGIVNNPYIRSLTPIGSAMRGPADTTVAGRPMLSLSFAFNYALNSDAEPLAVRPYHLVNLGVHLAAALVLFGLVRRTLTSSPMRDRCGTASHPLAFCVALLWVVHPLNTQAVTYVVQRAESLMGLFYLLTLYCAARATDSPSASRYWVAAAIAFCAVGMGSKEVMVTAPLITLAWVWLFRRPGEMSRSAVVTLFGGLAATWLILAWLVVSAARTESVGFALGGWTWWSYLRTQSEVVIHYLQLAFFPSPLVFSYAWPPALSWRQVAPELAVLCALAATTAVALSRRHPAAFLGICFFVILAPSSSVLPIVTEIAAEHRMYLPLAAVIAGAVLAAYSLSVRLTAPQSASGILVGSVIVAALLGYLAFERNKDYASAETLMRDTVAKRPGNAKVRVALGGDLLGQGRNSEAEKVLRDVIASASQAGDTGVQPLAHMYLGASLAAQGRLDEGIPHLEQARKERPALGEVHAFLGEAYATQGRYADAAASFKQAVALIPDVPQLLTRAASVMATAPDAAARDGVAAVQFAERAVQLTEGADWMALDALAAGYAELGRFDEAIAAVRRAATVTQRAGDTAASALLQSRASLYAGRQPFRIR